MEHYTHLKVNKYLTKIFTSTNEVIYFIEGEERAMLIDSGVGLGNIKAYVDSFAQKPYELLLTHGHTDHAGATGLFPYAYINAKDIPVALQADTYEVKAPYAAMRLGYRPKPEAFVDNTNTIWREVRDEHEFNLGGITLHLCEIPGHTPGIFAILIKELRSIILGDACNKYTLIPGPLTISEFRASLLNFKAKYFDMFDLVYSSHGDGELTKEVIDGVLRTCDLVLRKQDEKIPRRFLTMNLYLAKAVKPRSIDRVDGGVGNILYAKDLVK